MVNRIVIGANLGDEGKGTVVAHYTKHANGRVLNVLTNGGAQRAHSILTEDGSFTFQHFGSGTYYGADSYFSKYFILNPMQFVKEYQDHTSRGVKIGKIYRHPQCMWSTPFDMMANQIKEQLRGFAKHGSCGMGIWETILRYKSTMTIPFDTFMLLSIDRKKSYLHDIKDYYERSIEIPDNWKDIWNGYQLFDHFIDDCITMNDLTTTVLDFSNYDETIYENGQGLMLCDQGQDIAGTTPSFTDSRNALSMINPDDETYVHYVTRPYLTRHGKGYLPSETTRHYIAGDISIDRTNHYNEFQGNFRYAFLDINSLKERITKDCADPIIELTHCDEMDREQEFRKVFNDVRTYDSAIIK